MKNIDINPITIIIADDHPLMRSGVRTELESVSHFSVLAEASDGEEAYQAVQKLHPDIAILDFQMPKLNGLEITRKLEDTHSTTRVILLTMHRDKKIFYTALDAGVYGYVLKDDAITDIVRATKNVAAGEHFISNALSELLIEKAKNNSLQKNVDSSLSALTSAEKNILALIAELHSNEEIATALFISKRTVENYKVTISDKLQLHGSRNLLRFALQNKDLF